MVWSAVIAEIEKLINQYGPAAENYIDSYIVGLNLNPLFTEILEDIVTGLFTLLAVPASKLKKYVKK
jgi:hypothetical protein